MPSLPTVVIGAGPAGYVCAIRLAQLGKKVVLIEKGAIGGVCLNQGCIPSKALITAASLFEKIKHAHRMGIEVATPKINFSKMLEWKQGVVNTLTQGVETLLKANKVQIMRGAARFTSPTQLEITTDLKSEILSFESCVIATGSQPLALPQLPFNPQTVWDSTTALNASKQPESLLCVGGGYIGLELGMFYAKIGTKVTIVEAQNRLLPLIDEDILRILLKRLKDLGVEVLTDTQLTQVTPQKEGLQVTLDHPNKKTLFANAALVTIGRKPVHSELNLATAGVALHTDGFIKIEKNCQTTNPRIYAIGDVAGQPLLAHKGSAEAMIAAEAIAGMRTQWNHLCIPAVIFTDPEIASVGLTETEALRTQVAFRVATFPFAANGRALSLEETTGFVKLIFDPTPPHRKLLGMHIIGPEASQLISEGTLALEMGASIDDLALTIHPHPTLSEAIMEAAHAGLGHAIHIFKPKTS
jgi:dihydrolipoamide dehydrogenase